MEDADPSCTTLDVDFRVIVRRTSLPSELSCINLKDASPRRSIVAAETLCCDHSDCRLARISRPASKYAWHDTSYHPFLGDLQHWRYQGDPSRIQRKATLLSCSFSELFICAECTILTTRSLTRLATGLRSSRPIRKKWILPSHTRINGFWPYKYLIPSSSYMKIGFSIRIIR